MLTVTIKRNDGTEEVLSVKGVKTANPSEKCKPGEADFITITHESGALEDLKEECLVYVMGLEGSQCARYIVKGWPQ